MICALALIVRPFKRQKALAEARACGLIWCLFRARFGRGSGSCLRLVGLGVLATKAFDASSGVYQLLFAGEKRVAIGANFQVDIALMR
jgi:hypothetical protein